MPFQRSPLVASKDRPAFPRASYTCCLRLSHARNWISLTVRNTLRRFLTYTLRTDLTSLQVLKPQYFFRSVRDFPYRLGKILKYLVVFSISELVPSKSPTISSEIHWYRMLFVFVLRILQYSLNAYAVFPM